MSRPGVSLIVAVAQNGVIGKDNALPWQLSSDLKRFKQLTMGHPIIMGRKTFESIGRPLPGRQNIVVTRQPHLHFDGVTMARSLEDGLTRCEACEEAFVIGGYSLFEEALEAAATVYLTRVEAQIDGDVFFPTFPTDAWHCVSREAVAADEHNQYDSSFQVWKRV